ncbi:hypothetical protein Scep_004415 [Stephania cephalantha]|uniref:CCHC-type domain-containing protein n=1 Tax=Stephania cephalantha TaxID=152367 RepID=A0AAP0PZ30_9MAGN
MTQCSGKNVLLQDYHHTLLPKLKISSMSIMTILLLELSYGDITQVVQTCALSICNDMKLNRQIQKEKSTLKHDLGNFCFDFGQEIDVSRYTTPKHRTKNTKRPKTNTYLYKPPYYQKSTSKVRYSKQQRPSYLYTQRSIDPHTKENLCYKCGRPGHYANKCRVAPMKIGHVAFSASDKEKCHCVSNLPHTSSSSSSSEPEIHVLTAYEDLLLAIGDHISDPDLKYQYFTKVVKQDEASSSSPPIKQAFSPKKRQQKFNEQLSIDDSHLNFSNLMEIVNNKKSTKQTTIHSLQTDINHLKNEIKQLTSRIVRLEQTDVEAHYQFDENDIFSLSKSILQIVTKRHLILHLANINGMLCHSV